MRLCGNKLDFCSKLALTRVVMAIRRSGVTLSRASTSSWLRAPPSTSRRRIDSPECDLLSFFQTVNYLNLAFYVLCFLFTFIVKKCRCQGLHSSFTNVHKLQRHLKKEWIKKESHYSFSQRRLVWTGWSVCIASLQPGYEEAPNKLKGRHADANFLLSLTLSVFVWTVRSTGACLASSAFSSPFIKRTSALVSEKIYTPWKRGGELAQIYEHRPQWQGTGSCYLTFEQRMWKKIGDGGNRKLEQQRGGEGLRNEWDIAGPK